MGTATIPRGGGTAAPAKGLPNQPGNPNEIKPFQRPSSPPPAQSPPATPPPSSEIKPFQRPSAPPAAAPQNEIKPFQRGSSVPEAPPAAAPKTRFGQFRRPSSTPEPLPPKPSPIKGSPTRPSNNRERGWDTSGTDRAFQSGLDAAKSRSDELDRLYPPLDPSKSKYSPEYERNPPQGGGANWYDDLERRGTLDRAKEAAKRAWEKLWNPAGSQKPRNPDPYDPENLPPPVGNLGTEYRVVSSYTLSGSPVNGLFDVIRDGPIGPITKSIPLGSTRVYWGYMTGNGFSGLVLYGGTELIWTHSVQPRNGGQPFPFSPVPTPVDFPSPVDYGLMPQGLPTPPPGKTPQPSPKTPPAPRSPQPSPPPTPKRTPRKAPAPSPNPNPNPNPGPDAPPSPAQGSPGYPSPGPSPAGPSTSTTTSPNISPKDGREKAPNQDPNKDPDPQQDPEMNCKDPCIGSIQEQQQAIDELKEQIAQLKKIILDK